LYDRAQKLLRGEEEKGEGNLDEAMRCCKRALAAMSDELDGGRGLAGVARSPKTKAQSASDMALTRELLFLVHDLSSAMTAVAEDSGSEYTSGSSGDGDGGDGD